MIRELKPEDTHLAYAAMLLLRPGIGAEADFVRRVNELERPEGYRLVASFSDAEKEAAAVAGFRVVHYLAWGYSLYCDDLSSGRSSAVRATQASSSIGWWKKHGVLAVSSSTSTPASARTARMRTAST